jgi:hypothetical protein
MLAARDAAYAERDAALAARDAALAQGDVLSKIISKSMRVPSVLDEPQIAVDEACSLTSIRLYEIWTSHGSQLFADEKTGCVYHARHSARGCRILVWLPPGRSGDCFLLSSIANIPFLHLTMDGDRRLSTRLPVILYAPNPATSRLEHRSLRTARHWDHGKSFR